MKGHHCFLLLCLAIGGCGYHFQGSTAPEPTVEVQLFENHTIETGIEAIITERLLGELRRTPGWRVVAPGRGRYVVQGTVLEFSSASNLVSSKSHLAVEQRAWLVLEVRFQDRQSGEELWRAPALRTFADYPLGPDILANEREKRLAIARIAEELASRIRVHIQDTW